MRSILLVITALALVARPAAAQETPRFGLVMGFPAQVGALIRLSDRIAVRPEVSWSDSTFETTSTGSIISFPSLTPIEVIRTTTTGVTHVGIGISGLVYLSKGDALRTYVSPRFVYERLTTTSEVTSTLLPPPGPQDTTTVTPNYEGGGSIGAQYALGRRFGVFGEVGVSYGRSVAPTSTPAPVNSVRIDSTTRHIGLRSGVGVILFF